MSDTQSEAETEEERKARVQAQEERIKANFRLVKSQGRAAEELGITPERIKELSDEVDAE